MVPAGADEYAGPGALLPGEDGRAVPYPRLVSGVATVPRLRMPAVLDALRSVDGLPAARSPRYRTLDHWRGIACLMVVVFHSTSVWAVAAAESTPDAPLGDRLASLALGATRFLWLGVPFFFVISGYAISATADASRRLVGGVRGYAWRRFRRIYPPYWAMIALQAGILLGLDVVLVPGLLTQSPAPIERPWLFSVPQWLGNLTLTESWRFHLIATDSPRAYLLGQAWTLAYEEQFYLVMGVLILAVPRRLFGAAALVTIGVLLAPLAASRLHLHINGFFFDGYWLIFAAGILVYRQVNYGGRAGSVAAWLLLALGALYSLRRGLPLSTTNEFLLSGFLFAGLVLAIHRLDARLDAAKALAPIRFLGTICYSMYLSHAVIVRAISTGFWNVGLTDPVATLVVVVPVCVAAAIIVATGFHRLVERHFVTRSASGGFAGAVAPVAVSPARSGDG
jgi:peptidoglycan/LPS O-acetylase OafA/YrhL